MKTLNFDYENGRFRATLPESLVWKNSGYWNLEPPHDSAINDERRGIVNIRWLIGHRYGIENPTYGDLAEILIKGFNYKNMDLVHMAHAILDDLAATNILTEEVRYGTLLNPKNPRDYEYIRRCIEYEEQIAPQRKVWEKYGKKDPIEN